MVIEGTDLSAWLTGHPSLASSARAWKSSAEMPGTEPTVLSLISVMPSPGTKAGLAARFLGARRPGDVERALPGRLERDLSGPGEEVTLPVGVSGARG